MSHAYVCEGPDCDTVIEGDVIELGWWAEPEDPDDDADFAESHFCSMACLAAWSFSMAAADSPNL